MLANQWRLMHASSLQPFITNLLTCSYFDMLYEKWNKLFKDEETFWDWQLDGSYNCVHAILCVAWDSFVDAVSNYFFQEEIITTVTSLHSVTSLS